MTKISVLEITDPVWISVIPIIAGVIGLLNLALLYFMRIAPVVIDDDTETHKKLKEIAKYIKDGARSFLVKEYTYLFFFVIVMGIILGVVADEEQKGITIGAFVVGAFLSASCGWIGMAIATDANAKTTFMAEQEGLNAALRVAFASGSVMGFGVTCSGIIGLSLIYLYGGLGQENTRYLAGFGFGASSIALFARVGGGIYTKAADVGADLVGKVEAGFDEDSPRNPATIADNVGDNVGDVAGMGADLFESFVGSIIAAIQLAPEFAFSVNGREADLIFVTDGLMGVPPEGAWREEVVADVMCLIAFPMWIAATGIVMSCLGVYMIRISDEKAKKLDGNELQEKLLWTIRYGIFGTSLFASACALGCAIILFGDDGEIAYKLWACTAIGLVTGVLIGIWTEYATAYTYKPTRTIAKKSFMGPAPVVIQGMGIGMLSTMGPTILIFIATISCYKLAMTYGIAIAAVGMLSTLGVTLATDAFGPVADNAGGLAEMAEFPEEVRDTTDALDSLGNTTAATGKGFAIGSAVLSALALLSAFKNDAHIAVVDVSKAEVLAATIWGACLPFIFAAMTMMAVGRAATMMIGEVRRQIKLYRLADDDWDINDESRRPDYNECVAISTAASVMEMIIPGVLAIVSPLFIGYLLGAEALGGMLVGGITCGFMVAVYMANAGGAWDNAKKYVEAKQLRRPDGTVVLKGTDEHAAVVAGDTIGDPFKDTSGPALNILMKLMTMVSLVFANSQFQGLGPYDPDKWYIALIIGVLFMIMAVGLTLYMRAMGFGKIPKETKDTEMTNGSDNEISPEEKQALK